MSYPDYKKPLTAASNPVYVTKQQLAAHLGVTPRFIEKLTDRKVLPVIRISRRCVRYHLLRVETALSRLEQKELATE